MHMTLHRFSFLLAGTLIIGLISAGCGNNNISPDNPVIPPDSNVRTPDGTSGRVLWGLWDIGIDTVNGEFSIVPLRAAEFHINALGFLEPPALTGLAIDNGTIKFDIPNNSVEVDVILNHPFPGLNQYTGFDVRGIVMMPGAGIPFSDWTLILPGTSTPHLVNLDGYTRWWNPKEFPGTGLFAFKEGLLGSKEGHGYFTATVNGYKYFTDGLNAVEDAKNAGPGRGKFSAGESNRRNFKLNFGDDPADWLHFQYAVDASWAKPFTMDNPNVPDDFPIEANAPEGWHLDVNVIENTLWWLQGIGMGGELLMAVDVYSWRLNEITRVTFECPGIVSTVIEGTVVPGSGGGPDDPAYSTYNFEVIPDLLASSEPQDSLFTVETDLSYKQGGKTLFFGPESAKISNYLFYKVDTSFTPPLKWELITAGLLNQQPTTVIKEMSVVGDGDFEGVYFFGDEYKLYRYDSLYQNVEQVTALSGFFGFSELDLYGAPETLGRFEVCQSGQFVASSISDAPSPTFLGGLKRDYAFFFNEYYSLSGQLPTQVGLPNPSSGFFKFIDTSANWEPEAENAKIYWIQVDDPDEPTEPDPDITVILGVYQYGFTGNPFSLDIDYLSASLVPIGSGDGEVDITSVDRFAIDGDPQGVTGSTDLITWFLETNPPVLECFSIVSTDDSGDLNLHLRTIDTFQATPRDIEVIPAHKGGYGLYNWVVVLEEGAGTWSIETFDQFGELWVSAYDIQGYPVCMDIDPVNYRLHVWFTPELGGDVFYAVLELQLG